MTSVKFDCNETPKKILELIDTNKDEMSNLDYLYMCNFMKSKYNTLNSDKVVETVRRRYQKDEKVLYNGRDGTMKWCTIVSFDSTSRSYVIKLKYCGTIRDTVAVRLYELDELIQSTQVESDEDTTKLLGCQVKYEIPYPNIKNKNKILADIRYRKFMINETKYNMNDCLEVLQMSGLTINQCYNLTTYTVELFFNLVSKYITQDEFYILLDFARNERCRMSHEYLNIRSGYMDVLGEDIGRNLKLVFD